MDGINEALYNGIIVCKWFSPNCSDITIQEVLERNPTRWEVINWSGLCSEEGALWTFYACNWVGGGDIDVFGERHG
jgi:hypothetical protein